MPKHSVEFHEAATLLLAGHGSSKPGMDNPVHGHARTLAATGVFTAVIEGYLKQAPFLEEVLAGVATDNLFVVPMLTGHGYITDDLIPHALSKISDRTHIHLCEPIGCHPEIPKLLAGMIRSVIEDNGLASSAVSVILAAHGNRRNSQNADQTKALAQALAMLSDAHTVTAAFIEEAPLISDWHEAAETEHLIVLPFLIGGGLHGAVDVPDMMGLDADHPALIALGAASPAAGPFRVRDRTIWCCRSFGHEPALARMITDLVKETP